MEMITNNTITVFDEKQLAMQGLSDTYIRAVKKYLKSYKTVSIESIREFLLNTKAEYSSGTFVVYKQALKKWIVCNTTDLNIIAMVNTAFKEIKAPKRQRTIKDDSTVNTDVVNSMIEQSSIKTSLIIELLYASGMRVSELVGIELRNCKQVNINGTIYTNILIIGKGNKERTITINTQLFNDVRIAYSGSKYLFENSKGNHISRQYVYKVVNKTGHKVLGTNQVHPHTLRHSFATHSLVEGKQTLKSVSNYLGHSTTAITSDYYIHDSIDIDYIGGSRIRDRYVKENKA